MIRMTPMVASLLLGISFAACSSSTVERPGLMSAQPPSRCKERGEIAQHAWECCSDRSKEIIGGEGAQDQDRCL
jgi:hypothetical protein